MDRIPRDRRRDGDGSRRKKVFLCGAPINEIPRDEGRDRCGPSQMAGSRLPVGKHKILMGILQAGQMGMKGEIRPAMDKIAEMTEKSYAMDALASSIVKRSEEMSLEKVFKNIKTLSPNSPTTSKGIVLDRGKTLIYYNCINVVQCRLSDVIGGLE